MRILPSEDLKSRKIPCRSNLVKVNHEREQTGFPKVAFGGAEGIRTPDLLLAKQALSRLSYSPLVNYCIKCCAGAKASAFLVYDVAVILTKRIHKCRA